MLVNPPLPRGARQHPRSVPIGLAYLAAVVEEHGYDIKVVDCLPLNMNYDAMEKEVISFEPDIVGITSMTATFPFALEAARIIKESYPNALIVFGGPHVTFMDVDTLSKCHYVDLVVRGEGEETFLELVRCVSKKEKFDKIAGITFRRNGKIIRTPDRPFIQNLEKLPRPAYHLFPLEHYRPKFFGKMILPVITGRGCPFQCSFCSVNITLGRKFRARSPKNVVEELEWLKDEHGAEAFSFYDDTLTLDRDRIYKILELMQQKKVNLPWNCQTRTDLVSKEILINMKKAGCELVSFGVESGSQKMLDAMKKGTTVKQNENAVKWAKEAGLIVAVSIIIGYPGETAETLMETFDFIERVKPDMVYLCTAAPYPGTVLYELIRELGWKMYEDWSRFDTIDFAFENPFMPNDFLRKIRSDFYNRFYSPLYILRQFCKRNPYSSMLAKTALVHQLWRIKSIIKFQ
ncbi:MAG: radical SAM protein [Candidatus Bathyarchaeia archaeon]